MTLTLFCESCGPRDPADPRCEYWCLSSNKNRKPRPKRFFYINKWRFGTYHIGSVKVYRIGPFRIFTGSN